MFPIVFLFICFICINSHIPRSGNHTEWWERHQPAVRPSALWSCFCSTQSCDCLAESLKLQIPDLKTKAEKVLSNIKWQGSYTGGSGQWKAHHFGPGQHEGKPLSAAPPTTAHGTVQTREHLAEWQNNPQRLLSLWLRSKLLYCFALGFLFCFLVLLHSVAFRILNPVTCAPCLGSTVLTIGRPGKFSNFYKCLVFLFLGQYSIGRNQLSKFVEPRAKWKCRVPCSRSV